MASEIYTQSDSFRLEPKPLLANGGQRRHREALVAHGFQVREVRHECVPELQAHTTAESHLVLAPRMATRPTALPYRNFVHNPIMEIPRWLRHWPHFFNL